MRRAAVVCVSAALALSACNRQAPVEPASAPPSSTPPAASTVAMPAAPPVAAVAPPGPAFTGYGAARFGMTAQATRAAWGAPLNGTAPANARDCYQLTPASAKSPRDVAVMFEGDTFVRYDVRTSDEAAPGGGKVGMSADQVRALYSGRIREQPDKYVPGGTDLRVSASDDSGSALVFQTDAAGKVTAWRVGQPPAVDYTEGCS